MSIRIMHGDCLEHMRALAAEGVRVHAVVTDPPYGIDFMGKKWDARENVAFQAETWRRVFDCMLPGAHLLAFGAPRQEHRMVCAIEDAGFEIRDKLLWLFGSGFPKSLDVSKAIDKAAGAERAIVGSKLGMPGYSAKENDSEAHGRTAFGKFTDAAAECSITAPATDAARQWSGWGTNLKPSFEPVVLARRPLDGTVAANVLRHGCGGINVDACRIGTEQTTTVRSGNSGGNGAYGRDERKFKRLNPPGRFPANLLHDGSDEVEAAFAVFAGKGASPSRFFYSSKANAADRAGSLHPTVKPTDLMRWLVQLVTPPGGTVLDPFAGTGSTGLAADQLGMNSILIEQDATHVEDIKRKVGQGRDLFTDIV